MRLLFFGECNDLRRTIRNPRSANRGRGESEAIRLLTSESERRTSALKAKISRPPRRRVERQRKAARLDYASPRRGSKYRRFRCLIDGGGRELTVSRHEEN